VVATQRSFRNLSECFWNTINYSRQSWNCSRLPYFTSLFVFYVEYQTSLRNRYRNYRFRCSWLLGRCEFYFEFYIARVHFCPGVDRSSGRCLPEFNVVYSSYLKFNYVDLKLQFRCQFHLNNNYLHHLIHSLNQWTSCWDSTY